jgi:hypothetical protein
MSIGIFGPWLTYSYDPDSRLNPETKLGERFYHSRIELSPFYGSIYKDDIKIEEIWFISVGTTLSGIMIFVSASLSILKFKRSWTLFIIFILSTLGIFAFFMSLGRGIAIGVLTHIGWGLWLTGVGITFLFILSIKELSRNDMSRFVD